MFCSISTKHTKHPKNTGKHWKTQKTHNTLVYCGSFPRAKKFDCIAQNTFHKTSAKHRKTARQTPPNSHKTRFVKLRRKTLHNARKTLENVTKRSQYSHNAYCAHAFGVFSQNTLDLSRKHTIRNIRVNYGGGVTYPQGVT